LPNKTLTSPQMSAINRQLDAINPKPAAF